MFVDQDGSASAVDQRRAPRLALAAAEPLPGGVVRLSAPGRETLPLTALSSPDAPSAPASAGAAHREKVPFRWTGSGQVSSCPARRTGPRTAAPENRRTPALHRRVDNGLLVGRNPVAGGDRRPARR
ncbi:hypothetical protein [Streptomyces sp. NBC_01180]|uniref:hypothetical protein n=1 Tax=unclassified Streptomyces TaxID=2593676 RepID=UPI00386304D3